MARSSSSSPPAIGATLAPDVVRSELEGIELGELAPQFELEGVVLVGSVLGGAEAGSGRLERAQLDGVDLAGSKLPGLRLFDVSGERVDAVNGNWRGADLRRVDIRESRMTGLDLGEARLGEVRFKNCKLDYVNFRQCAIEQVTFEDCVMTAADFQGARIDATRFSGCQLGEADFSSAKLSHVDLRRTSWRFRLLGPHRGHKVGSASSSRRWGGPCGGGPEPARGSRARRPAPGRPRAGSGPTRPRS